MSVQPPMATLQPPPYHVTLRTFLKEHEPEVWRWFSSTQARTDYTESLRLELLKRTYRLDRTTHSELYALGDTALERLGLSVPLTVYQAQQSSALNAALYFMPGEAHIVLEGPILSLLNADELRAVLGHELAHYRLWQEADGEFFVMDRMVQAMAADRRAEPSHVNTARVLQLFTEIYADRGSLIVAGDLKTVVCSLVKVETGLPSVSAESYLQQAEEVFSKEQATTQGLSHPEAFIRARALSFAAAGREADQEIRRMIEGPLSLGALDLLGQRELTDLTRRLLRMLLAPKWFQTEPVLGHARLYFGDFERAPEGEIDGTLGEELAGTDQRLRDYLCYVLLDFAAVAPDLDRVPMAAAFLLADRLNLSERLAELATKELKIPKRDVNKLRHDANQIVDDASRQRD